MATRTTFSGASSFGTIALGTGTTTVHTHAVSSPAAIYLWCTNTSSTDQEIAVQFGAAGSASQIQQTVRAGETVLVLEGLRIGNTGTITALTTGSANELNVYGHQDLLD